MKMLPKVLFAGLLTLATFASTPAPLRATTICDICADTGGCFYCCRCDGGSNTYCQQECSAGV
jgi:hypothetical protein